MSKYCSICGRELKKSAGPIGPTCLRRTNRSLRRKSSKIPDHIMIDYLEKHDIFSEENYGQTKNDASSSNTKKKKTGKNG